MPLGVEHEEKQKALRVRRVSQPLMPLGVEHTLEVRQGECNSR